MAEHLGPMTLSQKRAGVLANEDPLRSDLFSAEHLEEHARLLAAEHKEAGPGRGKSLLPRLEENERILIAAYKTISNVSRGGELTPAAEWLIDNFHVVDEQLREIREDLPEGYYLELPKLRTGELAAYPRIYAIAVAVISHTDSRLDVDNLKRFIRAYQLITPLTIGEVWAIAITLRVALLENLRRIVSRTVTSRKSRREADALADKVLEKHTLPADQLIKFLDRNLKTEADPAFVVQFTQRLRDQGPAVTATLEWLNRQLARKGKTTEEIVQLEHQRQAAAQVTVANIITSMRLLSTLDWKEFFESVSLIDPMLKEDPACAYALMDFATRDHYRHVVERLSKSTGLSELAIARRALDMAAEEQQHQGGSRPETHVGYYFIDEGLPKLEKALGYRPGVGERMSRLLLKHPTIAYLGSLVLLSIGILTLILIYARSSGLNFLPLAAIVALFLIPASDLAVTFVNRAVSFVIKPQPLPKLDISSVHTESPCTLVVVPTFLVDLKEVHELLGRLEVHFLASGAEHFYFALLTDFVDAPQEQMPNDETLLAAVQQGVDVLNARYCVESTRKRFHLFHRRRQWNEAEGKWIGWERKRGKLHELNRLLRGAEDTSFIVATVDSTLLSQIRYVITLDSDTQLPREAASRLLGTALHPLNRPRLDEALGRVTRGYGILQPRISISLESGTRSFFARTFVGDTGLDPYTTAVSDVYQDLFGEGIYTGKGLYDVDAFEGALKDRIPENMVLSHDLFEGLFARTALVTDIELIDDYPSAYDLYARRSHRWTRGDWQIAPWMFSPLLKFVSQSKHHLPLISRWKIADNLRRSLLAPAQLLCLIAAWTVLPGSPVLWSVFILFGPMLPVPGALVGLLLNRPTGVTWKDHVVTGWTDVSVAASRVTLEITFMAHRAYIMSDAIVRVLYRKLISDRRLLEWVTAAHDQRAAASGPLAYLRFMSPAPVISMVSIVLILFVKPVAFVIAAPFLLAWAVSPFVAHWISRVTVAQQEVLTVKEKTIVRRIARSTWRYFEMLVGEEDHWLPPDNYQEDPQPVIAHRTSPTNIGMLLLSSIAAHDFGYTATLEFIERLELTFTTLEKLPRFRGHFFNWYDTRTLEPLTPQYVSTVDSGNLAGHLLVIKQTCIELPDYSLLNKRSREGLADTVKEMTSEVEKLDTSKQRTDVVPAKLLRDELAHCGQLVLEEPGTVSEWSSFFERLGQDVSKIHDIVNALAHEHGNENLAELRFWVEALLHQTQGFTRDLQTLLPWAKPLKKLLNLDSDGLSVELSGRWRKIKEGLETVPAPSQLAAICDRALIELAAFRPELEAWLASHASGQPDIVATLDRLTAAMEKTADARTSILARTTSIARLCERFLQEMDFHFLFDEKLKVLTIGYKVSEGQRDNSFYDLLASEARLTSFVAIATGDVLQEHWFRLGRQLTSVNGMRALISWSGTMFEYLMPLLVMRNYEGTLLDETYQTIVAAQISYGRQHGIPWGISESAYNARDPHLTYQYGPFGMPKLGLKRGLGENFVVAPYATMLAAMIRPHSALTNLSRLEREGARSRFGFYEAIDYTSNRLPPNQRCILVRAFMTHHQGMSMVALDNLLHDQIMHRRFHAAAAVQANELLLQERIPRAVPTAHPRGAEIASRAAVGMPAVSAVRRFATPDLPWPETQLLSNGSYSVMFTTGGGGYSTYRGIGVTRWREDPTRDHWGSFFYLRDVRSHAVWSASYQPMTRTPELYEVSFAEDKVEVRRQDVGIHTHTELIVSAEDNAEVHRVSITNHSSRAREIEFTSFCEVTLTNSAHDAAQPANSNLFIETEFVREEDALFARRRPQSDNDDQYWAVHTIAVEGQTVGAVQFETDRSRFLGRGRTPAEPSAVMEDRPLSGTVGPVLDPILSLRHRVLLQPEETARITLATGVAHSREDALQLADKYHDVNVFEREARLAWTRAQVEMRHLGIDAEEAHLFQQLGGRVLYANPTLRPRPYVLGLNSLTQTELWKYGISGDLPILLVRINNARDLDIVRQVVRGHEYLRLKGLLIDLVILNDQAPSYRQELQENLEALVSRSGSNHLMNKPGGIFLRRADLMPEADRILLHTVARVVLVTERGSLSDQLLRSEPQAELPPPFIPRWPPKLEGEPQARLPELLFFNGLGGFSRDGREYLILLGEGQWTPAPWSNVIANSMDFGFLVTETGSGFTWSVNSRNNRLTPWTNDAVSDPPGEVLYLRDEDTGAIWTPTPLPIREAAPYLIRHGQGYTIFEHSSNGIFQELSMFVPLDATVKIMKLRLRNRSARKRRLSLTTYQELVLGTQRSYSAPFIQTEADATTGAIFARNPYNDEFAGRVTYVATSESNRTVTCDRREFLGRNGSLARPVALRRTSLSGRIGAGLDPCIAMQSVFELAPDEEREIIVLLGQSENVDEARNVVSTYRQLTTVSTAFENVVAYWDELVGSMKISTPDSALDLIVNRWLLYQVLSCRLWTRSAFYQSSGAYGFRDQLQDVMALSYSSPELAREHILRAAGRQFKEGDVQHWWHLPTGQGLRSRLSDDRLWLPYVTSFYVKVTGDATVLDENVPFLDAPVLQPDELESYSQPKTVPITSNLFEHCVLAIERGLSVGTHGLPLMGTGDWNDGMNRVGFEGKGESVWLGWFLYYTLDEFSVICAARGETERADRYRQHMRELKNSIEANGWDGDWYLRAFFDDGTPLGSSRNEECRIDSIAQSWGVISGAAESDRAKHAMAAVDEQLIVRGEGLVRLLAPPFNKSDLEPGYIKGYVPGVRENGGQYTHAALWTLIAYAMLEDGDRAGELLALLNPINHSSTRAGLHKYKVEPYVVAADVYAAVPHQGRGGWTWYTGAAGWMYRAALESVLGFTLRGDLLSLQPCIPRAWPGYQISYRRGKTCYEITVENPSRVSSGVTGIELDGQYLEVNKLPLANDGQTHQVRVVLGPNLIPEPDQKLMVWHTQPQITS